MSKTIKELNFCAEKSSDSSRMTVCFFETLEAAQSWIGDSPSYKIKDMHTKETVIAKNAEMFNDRHSADDLVNTANSMLEAKRSFY